MKMKETFYFYFLLIEVLIWMRAEEIYSCVDSNLILIQIFWVTRTHALQDVSDSAEIIANEKPYLSTRWGRIKYTKL